MASIPAGQPVDYEGYEFDPRYFIHTAKNNITGFGHVIAEAVSNADEAITKRASKSSGPDRGRIEIAYDPQSLTLTVTDDGVGLTADQVHDRLRRVGAETTPGARRAFFHRGIREVFMAMGPSVVETIAEEGGEFRFTRALFHPKNGMAITERDVAVTTTLRDELGLAATGTRLTIPLRPLALLRPSQFTFPKLLEQIENCVQVRPVLADPDREVAFDFGDAPPRRIRFSYPAAAPLLAERPVSIGGLTGTIWTNATSAPIKTGGAGRQTRLFGILIRGERAAYEVSLGTSLQSYPSHRQVFGELRLDGIEQAQRAADEAQDDEAPLIYKADRSGLNSDHPLVEAIYAFLDAALGPLLAQLETKERARHVTEDVRRQLYELARLINDAVQLETFGDIPTPRGKITDETGPVVGPEPPIPPTEVEIPNVENGIAFARDRIFVKAGASRAVKVWFNTDLIPPGTDVAVDTQPDGLVHGAKLAGDVVPSPSKVGVAELLLSFHADEAEGRDEIRVASGGYTATLPVHVRFPRASGFIREILPVDEDWESGAAFYDPQAGRVKVYVGRPEFVSMATRAKGDKVEDPFKYPPYRLLIVESVREAALRTAAERRAEVLFDDLSADERKEPRALADLVLSEYQALDYRLRRALIDAFAYGS